MRCTPALALLLVLVPASTIAGSLSPDLRSRLVSSPTGAELPVIIEFAGHLDPGLSSGRRSDAPPVIRSLQARARQTQARVLGFLASRGYADRARSFWINNSIAVRLPEPILAELERFDEIERIEFDVPVVFDGRAEVSASATIQATEWNLPMIGADQAWAAGYDGTGIVVGSMDTGVDPNHPALAGKWRGGTNSWKDIVNGLPNPYDDHGHGTHTIGTMVGGDGPGPFVTDVGVAYGAQYIAVKVLNAMNGFNSSSTVIAGAEWILDPDSNPNTNDFPHVVNNSWLFFQQDFLGFRPAVVAWRAAGIVPVFALGNNGPGVATTAPPGNYDNTIGVGATTSSDAIASFSSRGPSPFGTGFPPDQRKPDLSAPGQFVLSCVPGGGYQYWGGTSMAAPHVAGVVALMLDANGGSLSYDEIREALINTSVDRGIAGYDFDFGYGRLDAMGAVTEAVIPGMHLTGLAANHTVNLTWNESARPGVIRYDVYRSPNAQDAVPDLIGSSSDTTYTDGARFGTFYYRVKAVRAGDQLPFTNEVAVSTCVTSTRRWTSVNGFSTSPVVADFDRDGDLDVAVTNTATPGTIELSLGDGTGGFAATASLPAGDRPTGLATGDFDGDSDLDLVATNDVSAGTVSVLLGAGDGTFAPAVTYPASQKPVAVLCGDFDQDGVTDLAVASNALNNVSILLGNGLAGVGDGTFAAGVPYLVSTRPTNLVSGDFNEDGVLDLAVACNGSGRVSVLLGRVTGGKGDGTFLPAIHYGSGIGTLDVAAGDFDDDGITDLAVTRNVDPGFVGILRGHGSGGTGDGTFETAVYHAAGALPQGIATGDLNGDGITDLCVANGSISNELSVFLGTGSGGVGNGGFERRVTVGGITSPCDVVVVDFDDSGTPDLVVATLTSFVNVNALLGNCGTDAGAAITVTAPAGGESWPGSTWHTIEWLRDAGVVSVDVEVSRDEGGTWETIATNLTGTSFPWFVSNPSSATGAARVRVSDRRLSAADVNDVGFTIAPDVRLDVPAGPRTVTALALAIENPAVEGLRVRYTLPSEATAILEVLDAAGRRVTRRVLSGLGAGDHTASLARGVRPGIYWVSLTQGERRLTRKAAVLK